MVPPSTLVPGVRVGVARAAWLFGALFFTLPLSSFWSPPEVPIVLKLLVAGLLTVAAFRPTAGLCVLAGLGPLAAPLNVISGKAPFGGNATLEAMVLAVLAGIAWRWCVLGPLTGGRLKWPSLLFGAVTVSSALVLLGVPQLAAGSLPPFLDACWTHITRDYFLQPRNFPPWHEAAVWVEALVLALMIERVVRSAPRSGLVLALVAACGLAGASTFSLLRLGQIAGRSPDVVSAFWQHALTTRISPHFPDVNAIGSLFALGTVCWLTIALGERLPRWARAGAIVAALVIGSALWLTGSRAAQGATLLTGLLMWRRLRRPSLTTMAAAVAVAGTIGLSLASATAAGTPRAPVATALDIRIQMALVGIRMAADHPWLGVGLGEFSRQSLQYISPHLIEQFPPAAFGENAHNELIQVLGELGVIGLVVFVWYWSRVLGPAIRRPRSQTSAGWLEAWTAGLCAFHLSALLGHPFLTPYVVFCVFVSVGVVAGLTPDD